MLKILSTVALLIAISLSTRVDAVSYDVSAKVSAVIASQPAEIVQPVTNSTSVVSQVQVSGTCPVTVPAQLVLIWRSGVFAGSGACSVGGTFSIDVSLSSGQNQLVPKIRNVTNDAGPDGQAVLIRYNPPEVPAAENDNTQNSTSSTSGSNPSGTNENSSSSNLNITTENMFVVIQEDGVTTVTITIADGDAPYVVSVDWGDGHTDTYNFKTSGQKELKHAYTTSESRSIQIAVTDESGKTVYITLGAVSYSGATKNFEADDSFLTKLKSYRGIIIGVTLAAFGSILVSTFVASGTASAGTTERGAKSGKGSKRGKK